MKIFLLLLLAFQFGCRREYALEYDNRQSTALLDTIDAMDQNDDAAALRSLPAIENDNFKEEARLVIQRRQQMKIVRECLNQGDFQSLRKYLKEKQRSGEAGQELLSLNVLPDDLQALTLFCSKMPWETSAALQEALIELQVHAKTLSQYKTFQQFYAEQQKTLASLKQKEAMEKARTWMERLDVAVAGGRSSEITRLANQLKRENPKADFEAMKSLVLKGKPLQGEPMLQAIAVADCWKTLTPPQRAHYCAALPPSPALCRDLVLACQANSAPQYEKLLLQFRGKRLEPTPDLVVYYLRTLPLEEVKSPTALPGYADVLSCLRQLK